MTAPLLTIGMATCDDFDGVYFTLTSLMVHHPEILRHCEFVVVDNNPQSVQGRAVREWIEQHVPNGSYHALPSPFGTAPARNEVFRRARGEYVLCMDCHVLIVSGAINRLLTFLQSAPYCIDLLMGPLLNDSGQVSATHQEPHWSSGAWGVWALDERGLDADGAPFEIWQQGMGLFACRRAAWVGFHPDFRGFGGCESFVMEKFRRQGGRVLCCPWLRWTHRFPRPLGVPYQVSRGDKLRNYLIAFRDLGWDTAPVEQHFATLAGTATPIARNRDSGIATGSVVVFGDRKLGAVQMRGQPVATHFQCPLIDPTNIPPGTRCEVGIAVKDCLPGVRDIADRLIYDPLDAFWRASPEISPGEFWRRQYDELHFDDILATSPECYQVMRESLPDRVQVHLVPHPADMRVQEDWFHQEGPIVYAGQTNFIASGLDKIRAACRRLGKEFVIGRSCEVLKGAALVLALRLPPYDTPLNRSCKPQVKIENAIAARLPVVTTDCPAATSLYPGISSVPVNFTPDLLAEVMQLAIERRDTWKPYFADHYLSAVNRIMGLPAWVVWTASFGRSGAPPEPDTRVPGVQYVCFTDDSRATSPIWSYRFRRPSQNPLMQTKACKILAHETLECDASLWIESTVKLQSLEGAFQFLSADVAAPRHRDRNCIYEEAVHCKMVRRGDPSLIDDAIARYRQQSHPPDYGLWDTGILLRRHNVTTQAFNAAWWREVTLGTPQDQIAFPVVLRSQAIAFETLPPGRPRTSASTERS